MEEKHQKWIWISLLCVLILIAGIFVYCQSQKAANKNELSTEIASIQNQIFEPIVDLTHNTNFITIVKINGWPITENEMLLRKNMKETNGAAIDENALFNTLVEEKIKLSHVQKAGVLPSMEEVQIAINEMKTAMQNINKLKTAIQADIDKMKMTEEDYWQVYEVYNQYRFIAFNHYSEVIKNSNTGEQPDLDLYYKEQLLQLKKDATIEWTKKKHTYKIQEDELFTA